jgi:uncharacterized protein (TIGR00255 family)
MDSMTGYGSALTDDDGLHIEVTVKSLNGRFLEPRFQLPHQYSPFENELKNVLQKYLSRGRVEIFVRRKQNGGGNLKTIVKADIARLWVEGYKKLGSELKLLADPNLDMVVRLPDVISFEEKMEVTSKEKKLLFDAFEEACKGCKQERRREGEMIKAELLSLTKEIEKKLDGVYKLRKQGNEALKKSLLKRLADLGFSNAQNDPRFIQEAALLVEKYDITEEVVRLREHIEVFRGVIKEGGAQGKKLDFYTQELLREANTIGSKSQVIKLTELVVEAKAIVERLKEQVQNVE